MEGSSVSDEVFASQDGDFYMLVNKLVWHKNVYHQVENTEVWKPKYRETEVRKMKVQKWEEKLPIGV